jgi:hypothetical protein
MATGSDYGLLNELVDDIGAIIESRDADDSFKVHLVRSKLLTFMREKEKMIRAYESYRKELTEEAARDPR